MYWSFVIPARFERATHSLEGCCSIQLSYGTGTEPSATERDCKYSYFFLIANVL